MYRKILVTRIVEVLQRRVILEYSFYFASVCSGLLNKCHLCLIKFHKTEKHGRLFPTRSTFPDTSRRWGYIGFWLTLHMLPFEKCRGTDRRFLWGKHRKTRTIIYFYKRRYETYLTFESSSWWPLEKVKWQRGHQIAILIAIEI